MSNVSDPDLEVLSAMICGGGSLVFQILLHEGDHAGAREYVLKEVDCCYLGGLITFEEAATIYTRLDTPLTRVFMFPQKHC